ncbi:MFS transporter [Streptacidiphilus melanogenes]|uniref:MFS transporter n=1 Tax=Streptacidiphilus melanogenes TaxID=411235 RepID=UPI000AAB105B|nr:MFS transporter [Streptacidiphilus melanogenes]
MSATVDAVGAPDDVTVDPEAPAATRAPGRAWTLAIVSIATFMLMLDLTVVNVALPDLRNALHADFSGLQWVLDAYALTLAAFLLTGGSLADRLGRKRVFIAGFAVFTAASLLCGAATNVITLNLARGLQGVGAAVLFSVGPALLGHEFRGKDRAMAFGVFGGVSGLAIAFGPLIGGALTSGVGWRWIFLVNVPIGVVAIVLSSLRIRESREPGAHGVDWPGLTLFSVALAALVLAFLRGEAEGWTSPLILSLFAASVVLLAAFLLVERRLGAAGMLDLSLVRNRTFNGISATTLLGNAAGMASIFLEVSYVQNVLGASPWQAGLRFLPLTLMLFVVAAVTGSLTVALPPRLLVGTSMTLMAGGLLAMRLVDVHSDWTAMLPSMLLTGGGMGMFNPPRASISIGVAEPARAGMAAGIGETFQQVGIAIGIAGFGALFQHRVGDAFAAAVPGLPASARQAVAAGAGDQVARSAGPLRAQVAEAARAAFVHGLTDVLTICAAVAAVAAVIAFATIRRKDLHESATGH